MKLGSSVFAKLSTQRSQQAEHARPFKMLVLLRYVYVYEIVALRYVYVYEIVALRYVYEIVAISGTCTELNVIGSDTAKVYLCFLLTFKR